MIETEICQHMYMPSPCRVCYLDMHMYVCLWHGMIACTANCAALAITSLWHFPQCAIVRAVHQVRQRDRAK